MVRTFIVPVPAEHGHVINALAFGCSKNQFDTMFRSECHARLPLMTERKKHLSRIFFGIGYM